MRARINEFIRILVNGDARYARIDHSFTGRDGRPVYVVFIYPPSGDSAPKKQFYSAEGLKRYTIAFRDHEGAWHELERQIS